MLPFPKFACRNESAAVFLLKWMDRGLCPLVPTGPKHANQAYQQTNGGMRRYAARALIESGGHGPIDITSAGPEAPNSKNVHSDRLPNFNSMLVKPPVRP